MPAAARVPQVEQRVPLPVQPLDELAGGEVAEDDGVRAGEDIGRGDRLGVLDRQRNARELLDPGLDLSGDLGVDGRAAADNDGARAAVLHQRRLDVVVPRPELVGFHVLLPRDGDEVDVVVPDRALPLEVEQHAPRSGAPTCVQDPGELLPSVALWGEPQLQASAVPVGMDRAEPGGRVGDQAVLQRQTVVSRLEVGDLLQQAGAGVRVVVGEPRGDAGGASAVSAARDDLHGGVARRSVGVAGGGAADADGPPLLPVLEAAIVEQVVGGLADGASDRHEGGESRNRCVSHWRVSPSAPDGRLDPRVSVGGGQTAHEQRLPGQ